MEEAPAIIFEEVKEGSSMEFFALRFKKVMNASDVYVKGSAWLGDPCYVPGLNERWDDFLEAFWEPDENGEREADSVVMEIDGECMVLGGTDSGDGVYHAEGACLRLGVDAGLLCVVPERLFERLGLHRNGEDYGGGFVDGISGSCWIDENHSLRCGHVVVHTQEMCGCCKETIRDCHCDRCEYCNEVEGWDCCCDKCDDCGCLANDDCTCDRCDECGCRRDDCYCDEIEHEEED